MIILSLKNKLKAAAIIICAAITAGSITYSPSERFVVIPQAKTIKQIEAEKAENQKKIDSLQKEINSLKNDVAQKQAYQKQLKEKIDLQNQNIEYVTSVIADLNDKIEKKEEKIDQLQTDIDKKQTDIDEGLELFKDRLRAMYVSGNDSLASALVGSTDFYDMLSKMELISQVAKHDDELIDSLNTQLNQYKEAQAQLDKEKKELTSDLETQQKNKKELSNSMAELQADFKETEDYITLNEANIASQQRDITELKADNEAKDREEQEINNEIARQKLAAERQKQALINAANNNTNTSNNNTGGNTSSGTASSSSGTASSGGSTNNSSSGSTGNSSSTGSNDTSASTNTTDTPAADTTTSDSSATASSGGFIWPVPGFYGISSGYGYRWGSLHKGIDIAGGGISGAGVVASASGTVSMVKSGCTHNYGKNGSCGCNGGYGNYLMVNHGNGFVTMYCHLASVNVSVGQAVSAGQSLGTVGSTGWSTGFHCHFEIRVNGSSVDPTKYLY